ncbi:MAG: hypothetical protein Q9201_001527, partial [Fulgogasparrea decipioides]
ALQSACLSLPPTIDIISLDCSVRYPFYFRQKTLLAAIERGIRFEICYGVGILGNGEQRRNLISNATQLVRATKGRGVVVSSEAGRALACRGHWDVVNLGQGWGLGRERAVEALGREARAVVLGAEMRKNSFRGVVDTVFGGEKPVEDKEEGPKGIKKGKMVQNGKRKAEESVERMAEVAEKPLSKRELKRRAKKARLEGAGEEVDGKDASIKISTDAKEHGDGDVPMTNGKDGG